MDEDAPITLGIYVGGEAVEAVSSNGHETVIRTANTQDRGAGSSSRSTAWTSSLGASCGRR
ncbi:MAG: hypothetical protein R3F62_22130 [Planctomycetota bacterium]